MGFWEGLASGISAIGDWASDTFFGGSKSSKLSAQNQELLASVEQQKALLASYQGTVQSLTAQIAGNSSKYLPWVIGGVGVLGGLFLISKKGRAF